MQIVKMNYPGMHSGQRSTVVDGITKFTSLKGTVTQECELVNQTQ